MIADRVIFVCIIILAAVYFYATQQIPSLEIGDPLGPKAFPRLLGICLLIAGALLFVEMWREARARPRQVVTKPPEDRRHYLVIGGVAVWMAIYFAFFERLGYVIATTIYLLALTAYFHRGKWVANVLTSILYCLGTYLMFKALEVNLPRGILSF